VTVSGVLWVDIRINAVYEILLLGPSCPLRDLSEITIENQGGESFLSADTEFQFPSDSS